jgi:hypothetical protein
MYISSFNVHKRILCTLNISNLYVNILASILTEKILDVI